MEADLYIFEQTAYRPKDELVQGLAPLLIGEGQLAYFSLPPASAEDYPILKEQILGHSGFSTCQAMTEFNHWVYRAGVNPCSQMDKLSRTTKCWIQPEQCSAVQVIEQVIVD